MVDIAPFLTKIYSEKGFDSKKTEVTPDRQ